MITVLRLGHRPTRDKRTTTHIALVARAFGADNIIVSTGDRDLEDTINDVTSRFGGSFSIRSGVNWRRFLREWEGTIVHLTMYGENINDVIPRVPKEDLLIVVGAGKIPREVYDLAHLNIAVGNQPHSEVAALAVFLDRLFGGKAWEREFDAKMKILPSKRGKRLVVQSPSDSDCIGMLRKTGCNEDVINHCKAVQKLAIKMAEAMGANIELVRVGALLHDIGRSRTHGIQHGLEGAKIARELGLPTSIIHIIERHIGGGIPSREAKELGLPEKDYIPRTLEEKIVAHADNLIRHTERQGVSSAIQKLERDGHIEAAKRVGDLHIELSKLCGIDLEDL